MKLDLIMPTAEYKQQVWRYRQEFIDSGDNLAGSAWLEQSTSFEEWLQGTINFRNKLTVPDGLVPSNSYLAIDADNRLVGMIDIRHTLNEHLLNFGGHIGYSVGACYRRKGCASQMLALALKECKKLGINKVLITCDKSNIASEKTIKKNGGIFENEMTEPHGNIVKRFWIEI